MREYFEPFAGDYYLKGPEFKKAVPAGNYQIVVFNRENTGKYVLAVGEKEVWDLASIIPTIYALPWLKVNFFNTSAMSLLPTPMGGLYVISLLFLLILIFIVWRLIRRKYNKGK